MITIIANNIPQLLLKKAADYGHKDTESLFDALSQFMGHPSPHKLTGIVNQKRNMNIKEACAAARFFGLKSFEELYRLEVSENFKTADELFETKLQKVS